MKTDDTDNDLTPGDRKRQAIIDASCELFRELIASHIDEATADANEQFQREDDETAPVAKLGFAVEFEPLNEAPEVKVKVAWTLKRRDEATKKIDPLQRKLPFPSETARTNIAREVQRRGYSVNITDQKVGVKIDKDGVSPIAEGAA